jgi:hypothetical protein
MEKLNETLTGEANLACMEPNLSVQLKSTPVGRIIAELSITPDHMAQRHWFQFQIDQTYLTPLIGQCQTILRLYPMRG